MKKGLLAGNISEGHARAILGLSSPQTILAAYRRILKEKLSVREVEELVRRLNDRKQKETLKTKEVVPDKQTIFYEKRLQHTYGGKLSIYRSKRGGKVVIPFSNDKELEIMYHKLLKK